VVIVLLVATNGFFRGIRNFALVFCRRARLEARAAAGSKNARSALRLIESPHRLHLCGAVGITLASLALGWMVNQLSPRGSIPLLTSIASEGRAGYVAHVMAIVVAFR